MVTSTGTPGTAVDFEVGRELLLTQCDNQRESANCGVSGRAALQNLLAQPQTIASLLPKRRMARARTAQECLVSSRSNTSTENGMTMLPVVEINNEKVVKLGGIASRYQPADFSNDDSSVPLGAMSPQVTSSTKPPGVP
eukprot:gene1362-21705_t